MGPRPKSACVPNQKKKRGKDLGKKKKSFVSHRNHRGIQLMARNEIGSFRFPLHNFQSEGMKKFYICGTEVRFFSARKMFCGIFH